MDSENKSKQSTNPREFAQQPPANLLDLPPTESTDSTLIIKMDSENKSEQSAYPGMFTQPPPADLLDLIPDASIDTTLMVKSFNQWKKCEQLGNGRYGEVYKYQTPIHDIPECAGKHLKRIKLWNLNEEDIKALQKRLANFIGELNMLHKVSSEYRERIVQFVGCHCESKKIILFTEFMPRGSIKGHIVQRPLEERVAVKYFSQVADGLRFLHHHQPTRIVHRDIKCDNLLLTENYNVKLADFGLAHYLAVDDDSNTMSMELESAGTLLFKAPEVLLGKEYGRGADVWSLACTLVEMLTQHPPHWDFKQKHKERTDYILIDKARSDPEQQLKYTGHLAPASSSSVRRLLNCMFVKNKKHRPNIDDVLDILTPTEDGKIIFDNTKLSVLETRIRLAV